MQCVYSRSSPDVLLTFTQPRRHRASVSRVGTFVRDGRRQMLPLPALDATAIDTAVRKTRSCRSGFCSSTRGPLAVFGGHQRRDRTRGVERRKRRVRYARAVPRSVFTARALRSLVACRSSVPAKPWALSSPFSQSGGPGVAQHHPLPALKSLGVSSNFRLQTTSAIFYATHASLHLSQMPRSKILPTARSSPNYARRMSFPYSQRGAGSHFPSAALRRRHFAMRATQLLRTSTDTPTATPSGTPFPAYQRCLLAVRTTLTTRRTGTLWRVRNMESNLYGAVATADVEDGASWLMAATASTVGIKQHPKSSVSCSRGRTGSTPVHGLDRFLGERSGMTDGVLRLTLHLRPRCFDTSARVSRTR